MTPDVVVVGGGPAGLATALALAPLGLRVVVADRRPFPLDKPCGEGLMPAGVRRLESLGVAVPGLPFRGIRYVMASGRTAEGVFREGPGRSCRRPVLWSAMAEAAGRVADLRDGVECRLAEGGVRLGAEVVRPQLVVGADGLASRIRRDARLEGAPCRLRRWGVRQHFRAAPWTDFVEVHWSPGAEAYVTPSGPGEVGVAFLWDAGLLRPPGGPALVPWLLARFPSLEGLQGADATGLPAAVGPLHRRPRGVTAPGLALVGDASGYLDAITGEGISLAAGQAMALAECLRTARDPLAEYERRHRSLGRSYTWMTSAVLLLARHPILAEGAVAVLRRWPGLFSWLLSVNQGTRPRPHPRPEPG